MSLRKDSRPASAGSVRWNLSEWSLRHLQGLVSSYHRRAILWMQHVARSFLFSGIGPSHGGWIAWRAESLTFRWQVFRSGDRENRIQDGHGQCFSCWVFRFLSVVASFISWFENVGKVKWFPLVYHNFILILLRHFSTPPTSIIVMLPCKSIRWWALTFSQRKDK